MKQLGIHMLYSVLGFSLSILFTILITIPVFLFYLIQLLASAISICWHQLKQKIGGIFHGKRIVKKVISSI